MHLVSPAVRGGALLGVTLLAYGGVFYDLGRSIGGGYQAAYLMVLPVLLVMIAYGRRRIAQLWPLWLYAAVAVTPVPSMVLTAGIGGSARAAAMAAAVIGAVAVFLASQPHRPRWRWAATRCCAAVGIGAASDSERIHCPPPLWRPAA